jgi:hypothetical protein
MKAGSRVRLAAHACGLAAAVFIGYALWLVVPQLLLMARTKEISAEVVNKDDPTGKTRSRRQGPMLLPELLRAHDSQGYSIYGMRGTFLFFVNGQTHIADAETPYRTRNVAELLAYRSAFQEGTSHLIRYDSAKPDRIYLEPGVAPRLWKPALWSTIAALILAGLFVVLFRFSRPRPLCASCGLVELESYYKFCPGCCATVSKK